MTNNDTSTVEVTNAIDDEEEEKMTIATTAGIKTIPLRSFKLSDGRIMDAKNTLQSFVTTNESSMLAPVVGTLPDGRIIDGKNTLQSFDHHTPANAARVDTNSSPIVNDNDTINSNSINSAFQIGRAHV